MKDMTREHALTSLQEATMRVEATRRRALEMYRESWAAQSSAIAAAANTEERTAAYWMQYGYRQALVDLWPEFKEADPDTSTGPLSWRPEDGDQPPPQEGQRPGPQGPGIDGEGPDIDAPRTALGGRIVPRNRR